MWNKTFPCMMLMVLLASGVAGCFELDAVLKVAPDGSGTYTERMVFGQQMMGMMSMMAAQGAQGGGKAKDPFEQMIDKKQLGKTAKGLGKGVTVKSAKVIEAKGGRKGTEVVYAFTDVNQVKLSLSPGGTGAMGSGGGMGAGPGGKAKGKDKEQFATFKFTKAAGARPAGLIIIMPKPEKPKGRAGEKPTPAKAEQPPQLSPSEKARMKQAMSNMRVRTVVTVGGKIVKSNATHPLKDKTGMILMEMRFGDLVKDDKAFDKLGISVGDDATFTEIKKKFSDPAFQKYIKIETQEKVDIQFK